MIDEKDDELPELEDAADRAKLPARRSEIPLRAARAKNAPAERKPFTPPDGPPRLRRPDPAIYSAMGQEAIFAMLADFYRELERSPIRSMFDADMLAASRKSAAFFVGLLGGPPLYQQRHGSPRMRARHLPFPIDEAARQTWLDCFDCVLEEAPERYGFPAEHIEGFREFLQGFSAWMVNKAG